MTEDTEHMRKWVRQNLVLFLLGCFLLIDVLSLGILLEMPGNTRETMVSEEWVMGGGVGIAPLKLSEIKGPTIDETAAAVVIDDSGEVLPLSLWVFLFVAYAALLIFNLSYDFERTTKIRWGWEAALTFCALLAWYAWDERGSELWYPLAIMKTGFLIYAIYLYLFDRKVLRRSLEEERIFVEDQHPTPL